MKAHHCYIFIQINFYDAFFVYNIIQTSCCFFFWKKVATFMSKVAHMFCWLLVLIETTGHEKDLSLPDFLFEARGRLFAGYHKGQNNLSHLSKISFIYNFILFKCRKSPHPWINVVYTTLVLGGGGGGTQGEGIGMSTVQKVAILKKSLNTFVPYCRFCLKISNATNMQSA